MPRLFLCVEVTIWRRADKQSIDKSKESDWQTDRQDVELILGCRDVGGVEVEGREREKERLEE